MKETEEYVDISKLAGIIIDNKKMTTSEYEKLSNFLGDKYFDFFRDNEDIIKDLLDRHGVGRVMFRNTRKTIKNFPERRVHIVKVKDKIDFLCETLSKNKNEKFLLICKEKDKVIEIGDSLKKRGSFKFSFFHEDLKVIERDRNAAWFSLPEGSQILLCSEIGSEGRNFQFASNLILFDLPKNPEILEQRIGRLDRIGQKEFINIYIPCLENDKEFALARWYDEGLNALKQNIPDGEIIYEAFKDKLENLDFNNLEKIIEDTKKLRQKNSRLLEEGRDRLLELNSFNAEKASSILSRINDWEEDSEIEEYMRGIFDFFGINDNPIDERTYV
ncbi:MAG TPA: helicase-related protein, partial [Spirochaetota bacterium]|nr:helicase-related protein [Spirochaetota bacterium]